jgi:hypothetical protein
MNYITQIFYLIMRPVRMVGDLMRRFAIGPRSVLGLSLAARLALFLGLCLLLTVLAVGFGLRINRADWDPQQWLAGIFVIALLVILIPVVFYFTLRLWLEGELSAFQEIDHAWRAGLAELRRQGLDLGQIPVFLVVGSQGEEQERGFFQASRWSLNVKDVPEGLQPLHWYANPEAIFVVCTDVGCLSKLSRDGIRKIEDANANVAPLAGAAAGKASIRDTLAPASLQQSAEVPDLRMSAPAAAFNPADLQGTMMPSLRETAAPSASGRPQRQSERIGLTEDEEAEQRRRLAYVCQLLHRARSPICPINGLLTILPYQVIMWEGSGDVAAERALRADLATIRESLNLRCPVTALVCGMERESGFRELVRRVGLERARDQRFGKGYELESPPLSEQLCAVNAHACGAFEDWVYALFRERDALGQAGNTKLYALLCKVRNQLQERMVKILECYVGQPEDEPFFFGGCYFAGAGEREDTQAFVRSVLAKMLKQQGDLQWADAALHQDRFYQKLAFLGFAADGALAIAILVLLVLLLRR